VFSTLYASDKDNLKTLFLFGDGTRSYCGFKDEEGFRNFYPFHPYQFELLQESLIALSKHNFFTGRQRSIGERSMLGILQDVAKSVAGEPVGALATFDRMFEGIRSALRGDLQTSIQTAERNLGGPGNLAVRLLKALFLVKFVTSFKATPRNCAILLIDRLDIDIMAHGQAVQQALNQLEHDTYIQRNGEAYEFLTDDEKDIETEIKHTDVNDSDIAALLGDIVFDDILQDSKLRYEDNKQDYPFTRKLDGHVFRKREYDLCIHVASPFHENFGDPISLVSQSLGKSELLVILPDDPRLMTDLKLHKQTEKYVQQNLSPSLPESRRRILTGKAQQNGDRRRALFDRLKDLLCRARLVLNGNDLTHASTDPRTRFAKAFQDLVRNAFRSLKMLRKNFSESDLREVLSTSADDFFKHDDGTMGEAEGEIILKLQGARNRGERVSVVDLINAFEKKPYGWPQIGTQCLIARLFMRGKAELRSGGNLLNSVEALEALSNNRNFASTIVTLQEQFDSAAVTRLKNFHREFFDVANQGNEAKEAAQQFQERLRAEAAELEKLASHAGTYPFLEKVTPVAAELRALADREWSHCLKNLGDFAEKLLDAKEATIDPLKQFYNGPKRAIYDDIRKFVRDEAPNFADVAGDDATELSETLGTEAPYKGNTLQQAKAKLDALRTKVSEVIDAARTGAVAKVEQARASVESTPEFAGLAAAEKAAVLAPFETAANQLKSERLAPVIRQVADRAAREILPQQLQKIAAITASKQPPAPGTPEKPKPVEYVSASAITVPFGKAVIESAADLDAYVDALKAAYSEELKNNRRITL